MGMLQTRLYAPMGKLQSRLYAPMDVPDALLLVKLPLHTMMDALLLVKLAPCPALARHGVWCGLETWGHLARLTTMLLSSVRHGIMLEASDRGALRFTVLYQLRTD